MKVFPMTNALTAEYFFEKADQCFRRSRGDRLKRADRGLDVVPVELAEQLHRGAADVVP